MYASVQQEMQIFVNKVDAVIDLVTSGIQLSLFFRKLSHRDAWSPYLF